MITNFFELNRITRIGIMHNSIVIAIVCFWNTKQKERAGLLRKPPLSFFIREIRFNSKKLVSILFKRYTRFTHGTAISI